MYNTCIPNGLEKRKKAWRFIGGVRSHGIYGGSRRRGDVRSYIYHIPMEKGVFGIFCARVIFICCYSGDLRYHQMNYMFQPHNLDNVIVLKSQW